VRTRDGVPDSRNAYGKTRTPAVRESGPESDANVVLEAVVIVGPSEWADTSMELSTAKLQLKYGSLACMEVLGRTVLGRTIEELMRGKVHSISVVADFSFSSAVMGEDNVGFSASKDVWRTASEKAASFNADAVLLIRLGAYMEFDAADMLQFHAVHGKPVTRACNDDGWLDLWVIDPKTVTGDDDLRSSLQSTAAASYVVSGYVNRLENPRDMRRLVADGFAARCDFRPQASEVKPGIWMAPGAQVERGARIVAPAFIGRNSKIADQCLITRGSNVESNSQVDYGTVIEDSTVLSNTYVGIGLDLSHSIVDGDNLLNLQHGVMLHISDPVVLRQMRDSRVRSGIDGSFLANLDVRNMAMSSAPEKGQ
jgi:hypothetical protein